MTVSRAQAVPLFLFPLSDEMDPKDQARRALMDQMIRPEAFAVHCAPRGRRPWPVSVMLRIMYVQKEEGWSDRRMVHQLRYNARVRYLVGLPLVGRTPSRSAIIDFRRCLLETKQHTLAFRQQQEFIAQAGLVAPGDGVIIDSTPFHTAASQPTVVGLVQHAMRRVLLAVRDWNKALAEQISARLRLEAWLKKRFQRCAAGLQSREGRRLWARCYKKAEQLLKAVPECPDPKVQAARALLRRVLDERGPDGTGTPPDRITNAMDRDARFGCKGNGSRRVTWHGYKNTIVTHVPTDLILTVHVMPAQHVDGDALVPATDSLRPVFQYPSAMDGDEAYTSQDNRRQMRLRGVSLIGPRRTKKRRGRVPGGGRVAQRADRGRRSRVEHVHAHLTRWRHNRRCPYLGLAKAWLQAAFAACAANLVRLLTLWREGRLTLPGLPAIA